MTCDRGQKYAALYFLFSKTKVIDSDPVFDRKEPWARASEEAEVPRLVLVSPGLFTLREVALIFSSVEWETIIPSPVCLPDIMKYALEIKK